MEDDIETIKSFFAQFGFDLEHDEEDDGGRWALMFAPPPNKLADVAAIIRRVPVVVDPKGNVWVQQPFSEL